MEHLLYDFTKRQTLWRPGLSGGGGRARDTALVGGGWQSLHKKLTSALGPTGSVSRPCGPRAFDIRSLSNIIGPFWRLSMSGATNECIIFCVPMYPLSTPIQPVDSEPNVRVGRKKDQKHGTGDCIVIMSVKLRIKSSVKK